MKRRKGEKEIRGGVFLLFFFFSPLLLFRSVPVPSLG
jgi:hypothetical protein